MGPTLFNIFINDLPLKLSNVLLFFFVDDVKALSKIQTVEDCELTLSDFDFIQEWSDVSKLPSCLPKSCVLHYGRSNTGYKYTIGNLPIHVVKELDDLGVLRTADFLYGEHVAKLALKVNCLVSMFLRAFTSRSSPFMLKIWVSNLRPKLEYASLIWDNSFGCPRLERIQCKFLKRIAGFCHLNYDVRLQQVGLHELTTRRQYHDILYIRKIISHFKRKIIIIKPFN